MFLFSGNTRVRHHPPRRIAPNCYAGRLGTTILGTTIALSIILALAFFNEVNLILVNELLMCLIKMC